MLLTAFYLVLLTLSLAWDRLRHGRIAKRAATDGRRYDRGATGQAARFSAQTRQSSYQRWTWGASQGAYRTAGLAIFVAMDLSRLAHESASGHEPALIGQDALSLGDTQSFGDQDDVLAATGFSFDTPHDLVLAAVSPMDHEAAVVWSALHAEPHAAVLGHEGWLI